MNFKEMNQEELICYIQSLNEGQSGKLGLVWDKEKVPEEIVLKCNENIPVLRNISPKNLLDSKSNKTINHLLLEGDNFHSLSVLSYTHGEMIDVIYIDPPYNTGSEDFIYNDKFVDLEDGYRHSKWLNFMDKRLKIARRLLKNDGIICISIDDNEFAQLKLLCDSIFGENNRLSTHHIQVRYAEKTLNEKNDWQPVMEYVLIYAKDKTIFNANKPKEDYSIDKFVFEMEELTSGTEFEVKGRKVTVFKKGEWKLKKQKKADINLLKETWVTGSIYSGTGNGTMVQNVIEPRIDLDGLGSLYKIDGLGEDGLGYRYFTGPQRKGATKCKMFSGVPTIRKKELKSGTATKYKSIPNLYDYSAEFGNIRHEGGISFNSGKKPVKMLKEIINYHPNKESVVLDFFAGSGSTGHAVLELNSEDKGGRTFIVCTNNEISAKLEKEFKKDNKLTDDELMNFKQKNNKKWLDFVSENGICSTITFPRLKNVIKGYNGKKGFGGNLRYFKTEFVKNTGSKDQLYYDLTSKCIPMLCVKENTHILVEQNEEFVIYSNESRTRYACVYFDAFGVNYKTFINKIEKIEEYKALYIFTLGNEVNMNELVDVKNFGVEPIPYKILELYKRIVEISKERL